jgi:hypothetical protein
MCELIGMRKGVEVRLGLGDRDRLDAVIGSGNSPQKHVWRAPIVLLSADGLGTMAIQRQTGKGKPTIWRWQARLIILLAHRAQHGLDEVGAVDAEHPRDPKKQMGRICACYSRLARRLRHSENVERGDWLVLAVGRCGCAGINVVRRQMNDRQALFCGGPGDNFRTAGIHREGAQSRHGRGRKRCAI